MIKYNFNSLYKNKLNLSINNILLIFILILLFIIIIKYLLSNRTNCTNIEKFTPSEIKAFTTDQIQALTTDQIIAFTPLEIQAFTKDQIKAFTTGQIKEFTRDQIIVFTSDQISSFLPEQITAFKKNQLASFYPSQIKALTLPQIDAISTNYSDNLNTESPFFALNDYKLLVMTDDQKKSLQTGLISVFNNDSYTEKIKVHYFAYDVKREIFGPVLGQLNIPNDDIKNLCLYDFFPEQIQNLSPLQISLLTTTHSIIKDGDIIKESAPGTCGRSQIEQLSADLMYDKLPLLTKLQIQALTPTQIQAFTIKQIQAFTVVDTPANRNKLSYTYFISKLPDNSLGKFITTRLGAKFVNAQIQALTPTQINALTLDQIRNLLNKQTDVLIGAQITALLSDYVVGTNIVITSMNKVQALNDYQILRFMNLYFLSTHITYLSAAQISILTNNSTLNLGLIQRKLGSKLLSYEQIQGIHPSIIKLLTSAQLTLFLSSLSPIQIAELTSVQITALSTAQWNSLTSIQIAALTSIQITGLTPSQWGKLTSTQIAALTPSNFDKLSYIQLNAFTTTQLAAVFTFDQLSAIDSTDNYNYQLIPEKDKPNYKKRLEAIINTDAKIQVLAGSTIFFLLGNEYSSLYTKLNLLTVSQINKLSQLQLERILKFYPIINFTQTQVQALTNAHLLFLTSPNYEIAPPNPPRIKDLNVTFLSTSQISFLTLPYKYTDSIIRSDDGQSFLEDANGNFTFKCITTTQDPLEMTGAISELTTTQISLLTVTQVPFLKLRYLTTLQIKALIKKQIDACTATQFILPDVTKKYFTPEQIVWIKTKSIKNVLVNKANFERVYPDTYFTSPDSSCSVFLLKY